MIALSAHDGPSSQVTVSLPLFPRTGRIDESLLVERPEDADEPSGYRLTNPPAKPHAST
ncbi:hypothetical protein ACFRAI_39640 [Streptomyces sp. NPDC056637]|uniref:hypothetical protein n=1 Tax=unclassified Streptomyces TaxID=2593676 RepID=UPI00362DA730